MRGPNIFKIYRHRQKWILSALVFTVLYNEFFSFWVDSWTWPLFNCHHSKTSSSSCQTMLIVSDPQILANSNGIFSLIEAFDNDVYLKRSFQMAVKHISPDVILFLGDLLDKGSQTVGEEYLSYTKRFDWVFQTGSSNPLVISIPGDNDIGGEGSDRITKAKAERFNSHFGSETRILNKYVDYLKVDRVTPDLNFPNTTFEEHIFRVVLSHIPLSFIQGIFSEAVMAKLKPHLIFSAHDHRFAMATTRYEPFHISFNTSEDKDIKNSLKIQKYLNDAECIEIIWPTCSYRMGETDVGYGVVSIGSDGKMEAGVLWIHSRFRSFIIYLSVLVLCAIFHLY